MTETLDPTIYPEYGAVEAPCWDSVIHEGDVGAVQVRSRRTAPRWRVEMSFDQEGANLGTLMAFFRARKGEGEEFWFYTPVISETWVTVAAGTGTGAELNFPFPGREVETGSSIVYVNAVADTNYTLGYDAGDTQKRQRIVFDGGHAPANGHAVTITYRGRRRMLGRLASEPRVTAHRVGRGRASVTLIGEET